ncbi:MULTISPECIES: hypothetical protein [unclassified Streptomyces]|nr:hypothetical protein [Streptomyces sp. NBC_00223]
MYGGYGMPAPRRTSRRPAAPTSDNHTYDQYTYDQHIHGTTT